MHLWQTEQWWALSGFMLQHLGHLKITIPSLNWDWMSAKLMDLWYIFHTFYQSTLKTYILWWHCLSELRRGHLASFLGGRPPPGRLHPRRGLCLWMSKAMDRGVVWRTERQSWHRRSAPTLGKHKTCHSNPSRAKIFRTYYADLLSGFFSDHVHRLQRAMRYSPSSSVIAIGPGLSLKWVSMTFRWHVLHKAPDSWEGLISQVFCFIHFSDFSVSLSLYLDCGELSRSWVELPDSNLPEGN